MAIITKPGSIERGVAASFTLNTADLLAHPDVAAHPIFSTLANWNRVALFYKSSTQDSMIQHTLFDPQVSTSADFFVDTDSDGDFEIQAVILYDVMGGSLFIRRADLTALDFDVIITLVGTVLQQSLGGTNIVTNFQSTGVNVGQSFQHTSNFTLTGVEFDLKKIGSPTGNIEARLYEGFSLVATSDQVDLSTIGTDFGYVEFPFSTPQTGLLASTSYSLNLFYDGGASVSGSNYIQVQYSLTDVYANGTRLDNIVAQSGDMNFKVSGVEV